ncbi:Nucleoporin NUP35 [Taenia solium]|eukprot:TsM_000334000 transcript=TsM_000334000 gene=TsM_000334000
MLYEPVGRPLGRDNGPQALWFQNIFCPNAMPSFTLEEVLRRYNGATVEMFGVGLPSPKCTTQSPTRNTKNSEPMSMGSPSTSSLNSSSPQYLPGFLMGDFQASSANGYQVSPIFKSQPYSPSSQHVRVVQPRLSGLRPPPSLERSVRRHASPPTQSLWSSASKKNMLCAGVSRVAPDSTSKKFVLSPSQPTVTRSTADTSRFSPVFHSPVQVSSLDKPHKDGCLAAPDDESATWITVFGYDPAQANFVLQHFAHLGTIEKYIIANGGNWMNIKYANKIQTRCALNKNGRVLAGKFMIGVRRCSDLNALTSSETVIPNSSDLMADVESTDAGENNISASHMQGLYKSPALKLDSPPHRSGAQTVAAAESPGPFNRSLTGGLNSPGPVRSGSGLTRHSSMRPLVAPYQPPPRLQVIRASHNQSFRAGTSPSSGLLSKALDYVFGWN